VRAPSVVYVDESNDDGFTMNDVAMGGIDLAKNAFAGHGVNATGRVVIR